MRCDVDEGSNADRDGVTSALRFCVIESSMEDLESRRKSEVKRKSKMISRVYQKPVLLTRNIPRKVPYEKQNCGVS